MVHKDNRVPLDAIHDAPVTAGQRYMIRRVLDIRWVCPAIDA
jgi:hypothetical protein